MRPRLGSPPEKSPTGTAGTSLTTALVVLGLAATAWVVAALSLPAVAARGQNIPQGIGVRVVAGREPNLRDLGPLGGLRPVSPVPRRKYIRGKLELIHHRRIGHIGT
jgi:hypothetical protein